MSYTEEVYERVVAQNPGEPEFHQAVKEVLDSLQIILLQILRIPWMQFSQNINILPDLLYRKSQQFFHIRADIICLICFGIQQIGRASCRERV